MPELRPDLITQVAGEVRRYLQAHPYASDTLLGVTKFWLNRELREPTTAIVERALESLLAEGEIERHQLPGGTQIYRRAIKPDAHDASPLRRSPRRDREQ